MNTQEIEIKIKQAESFAESIGKQIDSLKISQKAWLELAASLKLSKANLATCEALDAQNEPVDLGRKSVKAARQKLAELVAARPGLTTSEIVDVLTAMGTVVPMKVVVGKTQKSTRVMQTTWVSSAVNANQNLMNVKGKVYVKGYRSKNRTGEGSEILSDITSTVRQSNLAAQERNEVKDKLKKIIKQNPGSLVSEILDIAKENNIEVPYLEGGERAELSPIGRSGEWLWIWVNHSQDFSVANGKITLITQTN